MKLGRDGAFCHHEALQITMRIVSGHKFIKALSNWTDSMRYWTYSCSCKTLDLYPYFSEKLSYFLEIKQQMTWLRVIIIFKKFETVLRLSMAILHAVCHVKLTMIWRFNFVNERNFLASIIRSSRTNSFTYIDTIQWRSDLGIKKIH